MSCTPQGKVGLSSTSLLGAGNFAAILAHAMSAGAVTLRVAGVPCGLHSSARRPVTSVLSDLILSKAIALLDFALELISLAINSGKVVVSNISPLLLDLAL